MNITEESGDYTLYRLKNRIENLVESFTKERNLERRAEMRKTYATLIDKYHTITKIEVWEEEL